MNDWMDSTFFQCFIIFIITSNDCSCYLFGRSKQNQLWKEATVLNSISSTGLKKYANDLAVCDTNLAWFVSPEIGKKSMHCK